MARQPSTESDTWYFLRKLLTVYGPQLMPAPRYVWEADRWNELVFSLLVQVSAVPQSIVRRTVGQMAELELLNVPELAGCTADRARPAASEPLWARSIELLVEQGFSQSEAERGFAAVCQAARAFQEQDRGKPQRYLRRMAESLLDDFEGYLGLTELSSEEARNAITYWLQNALNLPLSLIDDSTREFAQSHGITAPELIEAADELGLDLAIVDDLTERWSLGQKQVREGTAPQSSRSDEAARST